MPVSGGPRTLCSDWSLQEACPGSYVVSRMDGEWAESLTNAHSHRGGELTVWKEGFPGCSDLYLGVPTYL